MIQLIGAGAASGVPVHDNLTAKATLLAHLGLANHTTVQGRGVIMLACDTIPIQLLTDHSAAWLSHLCQASLTRDMPL